MELLAINSAYMKHQIDFPALAKTLKRLLKEKGLTYRELAKHLGISESSVKKVFIGKDCSLSRLNAICGALGISLGNLIAGTEARDPDRFEFSEKQERFLTGDRRNFQVYWKLVYEERSLAEIRRELQLSESALFKILRALDQHALIELQPGNKIRYPNMEMVLWTGRGPVIEMTVKEWAPLIFKRVSENAGKEGHYLALRYFELTDKSVAEFSRALEDLYNEFGRRSVREKAMHRKDVRPMVFTGAMAPTTYVEEL